MMKRQPLSAEHKRKIVETRRNNGSYVAWNKGKHTGNYGNGFNKGSVPWNKGKEGVMPISWNKGSENGSLYSDEQLKRFSDSHKGKIGEKSSHWKGGITPENHLIRTSIEYSLWRQAVFARDNWTCQKCKVRGVTLHSHHIKSFARFPELRFAIDNGITFCKGCHKEFHKIYGKRNNNRQQLEEFLSKIV